MARPAVMVFGLGFLQRSLIEQCKKLGLYTVGVDIADDAACRDDVDAFEVIAGNDFRSTLAVAERYHVHGVVTAATDKPLVMMARVSEALCLPFYSVQTAEWSTDKLLMKRRFQEFGIPCAKGLELHSEEDLGKVEWEFPLIVKPRDNSGSRGVVLCENYASAKERIAEAFDNTKKGSVLIEEFIDGQEYSIESLHYRGGTHVIQFTEKMTTDFPYNVEVGHIQPAHLTKEQQGAIRTLIAQIAKAMEFDNCASHTELKIGSHGITVIETSPRLGGDFITSVLTPLSTGVNLEQLLVRMSIGEVVSDYEFVPTRDAASGIVFFEVPEGKVESVEGLDALKGIPGLRCYEFNKSVGDDIGPIRSSLDRYGYAVFGTDNRTLVEQSIVQAKAIIRKSVVIG